MSRKKVKDRLSDRIKKRSGTPRDPWRPRYDELYVYGITHEELEELRELEWEAATEKKSDIGNERPRNIDHTQLTVVVEATQEQLEEVYKIYVKELPAWFGKRHDLDHARNQLIRILAATVMGYVDEDCLAGVNTE